MIVVIERRTVGNCSELLVVPVATQPPERPEDGFEVSLKVKSHLGLDAERCWIMVNKLNRFLWPRLDLRPTERGDERTPVYGFIPQALSDKVLAAVIARAERGLLRVASRSE